MRRWRDTAVQYAAFHLLSSFMDAGCGSGLLTKRLAEKVPRGKVYAVDNDINMIRQAKRNLAELRNVEIVLTDIARVFLPNDWPRKFLEEKSML